MTTPGGHRPSVDIVETSETTTEIEWLDQGEIPEGAETEEVVEDTTYETTRTAVISEGDEHNPNRHIDYITTTTET